jgi:prepilin-type N-terminal cleavage/methylation domain-containing protein
VPTRHGYTLLELALVAAIMAVAAALAMPTIDGMLAQAKMSAATDAVRGAWSQARSRAINEGRVYRFSVVPDTGVYQVAPDSPEYWAGDPPEPTPDNPALVLRDTLPRGVRFNISGGGNGGGPGPAPTSAGGGDDEDDVKNVSAGSWSAGVYFLPDGRARDDCEIRFDIKGARSTVVQLRALTGNVTTRRLQPGEDR